MVTILCPKCKQPIDLDSNLVVGQQTTCQFCNTDLIVTWLFPVSLDVMEMLDQNLPHHDISLE